MTTITLTSDTRAILNDNGQITEVFFDLKTKKNINTAKTGALYIRLPKNSANRTSVSYNKISDGHEYELTERFDYDTMPKDINGQPENKKKKTAPIKEYLDDLTNYLADDEKQTFVNLLTKAITRKNAQDTLKELIALKEQKERESQELQKKIDELQQ